MKLSKWLLCVLMALTFTAGSALAADGDKPERKKKPAAERRVRPGKGKSALRGEYAIMVSECKLTDAQKAQLVEIVKAQGEARKAAAEKSAPIKKALAEAKKAEDKDKVKELSAQLKALRGDPKAGRAKIQAILTPEQKADWAAFNLFRNACRKFGKAKLTDDQKKAIRDLCAKSGIKATDDKKADAKAIKGLSDKIAADILTDEQRKACAPKPRPAGDKKPRDKKKKPKDQ